MTPIFVSIQQAVRLTGVSRTSLYRELKAGRIQSYKIRGRRVLLLQSLYELINAND